MVSREALRDWQTDSCTFPFQDPFSASALERPSSVINLREELPRLLSLAAKRLLRISAFTGGYKDRAGVVSMMFTPVTFGPCFEKRFYDQLGQLAKDT